MYFFRFLKNVVRVKTLTHADPSCDSLTCQYIYCNIVIVILTMEFVRSKSNKLFGRSPVSLGFGNANKGINQSSCVKPVELRLFFFLQNKNNTEFRRLKLHLTMTKAVLPRHSFHSYIRCSLLMPIVLEKRMICWRIIFLLGL